MNVVDAPAHLVERDCVGSQSLGMLLLNSSAIAFAAIRGGRIVFCNAAFHTMFQADGLIGVCLGDIVLDTDGDRLIEALAAAENAPTRYFGIGQRRDDAPFHLELYLAREVLDGEPIVIAFAWDITEQHRSREQLTYLAYTDPLTGLANHALFADRLHQAVLLARRHGMAFAVLMLDLDGFKAINDTYGHEMGDVALQLVGRRFQGCIREGDTFARIGGDEFAVLLTGLTDQQGPALVAQRMIDALAGPLDLGTIASVSGPASASPPGVNTPSRSMRYSPRPTRQCTAPSAHAGIDTAGPPGAQALTCCHSRRWPGAPHTRSASRRSTISMCTWQD